MKYQIVAITAGYETLIAETDDTKRAKRIYTDKVSQGSHIRVRVNGRMLRIFEADKQFITNNKHSMIGGKSYGKRTCKGNT
jgi:hypothetical protein